jgi:hypothetical protein
MCKRLFYPTLCLVFLAIAMPLHAFDADTDPSLVGLWRLDDATGTVALDSSGNDNHGTLNGGPEWVAGVLDGALSFDGQDDYVDCGNDSVFDITEQITLAIWVNANDIGNGQHNCWLGKGDTAYAIKHQSGNNIEFFIYNGDWNSINYTSGIDNLGGEWHHMAGTFDGTQLVLYIDGQEVDNLPLVTSISTASHSVTLAENSQATGRFFDGMLDDARIYNRALTAAEILVVMEGGGAPELASKPTPENEASDVVRDVILSWNTGEFAASHTVYLSTHYADVNNSSAAALVGENLTASNVDTSILDFGTTYYWRVDAVNSPPDRTVFTGDVWSFTVEPMAVPVENITATASGENVGMGPENTINGSGLNEMDQHSTDPLTMWLAPSTTPWIQYDFDKAYKLNELLVWNSNQAIEAFIGFGVKEMTIETSIDGETWTALDGVTTLARASGQSTYDAADVIDMGGVMAKAVRLSVVSAHGFTPQSGLAEVRFLAIPVAAREPQPADGRTSAGAAVQLSWRSGREAVSHDVALSTDMDAVANGTAPVSTVADASYDAGVLTYGTSYYWQVTEVNDAAVPAAHASALWSFNTPEYGTIDGIESYSAEEGEEVFTTWWDGFGGDAALGGSTTGHIDSPFVETSIVNSGSQSLPMFFDNNGGFMNIDGTTSAPRFSEVAREFNGLDLTEGDAEVLAVSFLGQAPGFVEEADGTITMGAAGADVWGTSDEFRYAYKTLSGNGSLTVKVNSLVNTHAWAKAGPMIRATATAGSQHGLVCVSGASGTSFQRRVLEAGASTSADNAGPTAPYWVRITRTDRTFTAEQSEDGVTWTHLGADPANSSIDISMPDTVLIGLALTSHVSDVSTVAEFSDVSFTGNVTGDWTVEAIGAAMPTNDTADPLYMIVEDSVGKTVTLTHPDTAAVQSTTWQDWLIPITELSSLKENNIKAITIGVGYKHGSQAGGEGVLYIDDLRVGTPIPTE